MQHKFITVQYLRGLAAVLVLASHALLYPMHEPNVGFSRLGWLGVILFFVISGFIMVVVTGKSRFSAASFLRRRFIRIVPMYWGATLLAAALALLVPQLFKTTVYDTGELVMSLLFVPFYNPESGGIHPLYKLGWTLNYEVYFYLWFALLAFLPVRARVIGLTVSFATLTVLGYLFQPEAAIPQFYTSFMPLAFCTGAWLGWWTLQGKISGVGGNMTTLFCAAGIAGLLQGFAWPGGHAEDGFAFVGLLVFAASTVLIAVRLEGRLPHIAWLEQVGDASYSIYLIHIYEVALVSMFAFAVLDPNDLVSDYLVAAVSVCGGTIAGLILYRKVEQPLPENLKKFSGKFRALAAS